MTTELYHPSGNNAIGIRKLPGNPVVSHPKYVLVTDWEVGDHFSCQGPNGVCALTNDTGFQSGWNPMEDEIMLLRTNGSVLRLTHHRSSECGYWVQPRASISQGTVEEDAFTDINQSISAGLTDRLALGAPG